MFYFWLYIMCVFFKNVSKNVLWIYKVVCHVSICMHRYNKNIQSWLRENYTVFVHLAVRYSKWNFQDEEEKYKIYKRKTYTRKKYWNKDLNIQCSLKYLQFKIFILIKI